MSALSGPTRDPDRAEGTRRANKTGLGKNKSVVMKKKRSDRK